MIYQHLFTALLLATISLNVSANNSVNTTSNEKEHYQTTSCDTYNFENALYAAFDPQIRNFIQLSIQLGMDNYPNPEDYFNEQKTFNIKVKNTYTGEIIEETWQTKPKSPFITKIYGPHVVWPRTQVGFIASMTNEGLELNLHDDLTYFDGKSLRDLKTNTFPTASINKCLIKALDKAFTKTVASHDSSAPNFGHIGLYGEPSSTVRTKTCKHTYNINGSKMISFNGSCR